MALPISRRRRLPSLLTRICEPARRLTRRVLKAGHSTIRALRATLAFGLLWGASHTVSAEASGVFLLYHHIDTTTPAITSTSPDDFEAHLDWLETHNFTVWPASKLVAGLRAGSVPERTVAITFDDAYASLLEHAAPRLAARGWPFTLFVATDPIGQHGYLSWADLREMVKLGGELGNHTVSHAHLQRRLPGETPDAWKARVAAEIDGASAALHERLEVTPTLFAYPYGEYSAEVQAIVRAKGLVGFGQQSGAAGTRSDFTVLPRFSLSGPYGKDLDGFATKAHTLPLPVTSPLPEPVATEPRPTLTLRFEPGFDLRQLGCFGPGGRMHVDLATAGQASITPVADLPPGRSRYNCTSPAAGGRYYWFSQLWIMPGPDGAWVPQ